MIITREFSFWIVFFGEGYKESIGRHIKFGGTYQDALEYAELKMLTKEYSDASYFKILDEYEYFKIYYNYGTRRY